MRSGHTAVPRWRATIGSAPGTATVGIPLEHEPTPTQLSAAHAKVVALLSGEDEVALGPVPLLVPVAGATWAGLVDRVRDAAAAPGHGFETVVGATPGTLPDGVVFGVSVADGALVLTYRTEDFDADHATRVAGYHRTALGRIAAEPDAPHEERSLLSAEERRHQLVGMAGPQRELPDRRFHELFEDRVRRHPGKTAAIMGERRITYAELNAHANRIARTLLARGLTAEDPVAVVTERNLDWMACVLAVFKAGGVYVPIEPHFPADRIGATLDRAGCALVLTEPASTATLDEALRHRPSVTVLHVDDGDGADPTDLGIDIGPGRLAYVYFTSGSTGTPKGVMCEHEGMLNHLYAKTDDLGVREDDVVAQVAPQCFDISLWQLVAALLVGGTTLIVPQEAILDVERFVEVVRGADVAQLVPSYLEVVLSHLEEHGGGLGRIRCLSATGEALKKELVERWFAAFPGTALVNAYGLTETSDDTNHEVMTEPPHGDRVPLGPAIANVRVYVVDPGLEPVPLGSPGEIVFAGVCVGRGYINDPERTAAAYGLDPHRPGERLYRSGDFGRWRPDGKLEFLGRRDAQVKLRGFRIELGEIENRLLGVAGIRDTAVVVVGESLAAFYAAAEEVPVDELRTRLAAALPPYMVPSRFHRLDALPLTANSKIDKKRLAELAAADEDGPEPPVTPTEQRIAAAWAAVLGLAPERVGRDSHFFDSGGTSLSAVRLVVKLDRAVSLKELTRYPRLRELAAFIDGTGEPQKADTGTGFLNPLLLPPSPTGTLVCFPYAGGNAINFHALAGELADSGLAVHGVELPGHDLTAETEPFVSLERAAKEVASEIGRCAAGPVLLWGHSSGAALAVTTARLLEQTGHDVRAVLIGGQLVGSPDVRRGHSAEIEALTPLEVAARLSGDGGYADLAGTDTTRAALVGAAYRHDVLEANAFFADAAENPPAVLLEAPLTLVTAADDPATRGHEGALPAWRRIARTVELRELPDGGHHFFRTRPAQTAAVVRAVHDMYRRERV
ncbi:non-ribosomal peptide synthetase [Streptomyces hilarionis]|uniref:non-ribosomal peptide synthetase n=1 Tax=Streptomyces hilarionis TaxID=2839954 RepID=UPI00211A818C|nr:amino acid adenylation domain-containing protein [Streptomyces hilarionis]